MTDKQYRFRVIAVSYYDIPHHKLASGYNTDDPVEAALIDQQNLRDDLLLLTETLTTYPPEIYVNNFDPGGQMFTDEFVREVIQILRITSLHIDISQDGWWESGLPNNNVVRIKFAGETLLGDIGFPPATLINIETTEYGRSIGEALRKVREYIREETGK